MAPTSRKNLLQKQENGGMPVTDNMPTQNEKATTGIALANPDNCDMYLVPVT
jgi:hypothetical protein